MLVGVKKNLGGGISVGEGVVKLKVRTKNDIWRLAEIYFLGNVEGKIERIKDWTEIREKKEQITIGEDARTGELGGRIWKKLRKRQKKGSQKIRN